MQIPDKIKQVVAVLNDELSWTVTEQLADNGKTTWQELLEASDRPKVTVFTAKLKLLIDTGLVDRYEVGRDLDGNTGVLSFDLSPFGRSVMNALLKAGE